MVKYVCNPKTGRIIRVDCSTYDAVRKSPIGNGNWRGRRKARQKKGWNPANRRNVNRNAVNRNVNRRNAEVAPPWSAGAQKDGPINISPMGQRSAAMLPQATNERWCYGTAGTNVSWVTRRLSRSVHGELAVITRKGFRPPVCAPGKCRRRSLKK